MAAVRPLILVVQAIVALGLLYHYLLLIAGPPARHSAQPTLTAGASRFAVAIPAHNEESVIGATVTRLRQMDYPEDRCQVYVVADHCSDATARIARAAGAIVYDRTEGPRGRKGYALAWLFQRLLQDPPRYDAVVVFDADSSVATDYLKWMDAALQAGAQVVQGRHVIANPKASSFAALADADMRLNNRIRNQAKKNLGLSARLMGDGMCFGRQLLETYPFRASSLTEDREYGIHLVAQGVRVQHMPQAVSEGQAAHRWSDATLQRRRWYGGVFDIQKRYLGPLFSAVWKKGSLDALDTVLELALPPFTVLCMLSVGLIALQGALWAAGLSSSIIPSICLAALAFAYPVLGLLFERAPGSSFRALLYGPFYAVWRVWVGMTARLRRGRVPWIRTRRDKEAVVQ